MKKHKSIILTFVLLGITGLLLILWITPFGPGVSPDSTTYLSGAKSLLSGDGFTTNREPITHYPPLYSLSLALMGIFVVDPLQSARILNALLFGINTALFAFSVYWATSRSYLSAAIAALFFLSSPPLLEIHSMAWSEPLFILGSLTCILFLTAYTAKKTRFLFIASSLSLGLAIVTRYIGIAFLPAALIVIYLSEPDRNFLNRFRLVLYWAMLACAPLGLVLARNMTVAGSATNRIVVLHPVSAIKFSKSFIETMMGFFSPNVIPFWFRASIIGLVVCFLIILVVFLLKQCAMGKVGYSTNLILIITSILFSAFYFLFLFISKSLFDAATPIDDRLLAPIFTILFIGAFSIVGAVTHKYKMPVFVWGFTLLVGISIFLKSPETLGKIVDIQGNGLGYTSKQWQSSESLAFIQQLDQDMEIYSNGFDVLGFVTGSLAHPLPYEVYSGTKEQNPRYEEELELMCKEIKENQALIVYFDRITRSYFPTQLELESACQLPILQDFGDGTVYGILSR